MSECWHRLPKLLWQSRETKLPPEQWQPEAVDILAAARQFEAEAAQKAAVLLKNIGHKM
jgi:hypothetical protein